MRRMKEAVVYLFCIYILCGKDFITEKVEKNLGDGGEVFVILTVIL